MCQCDEVRGTRCVVLPCTMTCHHLSGWDKWTQAFCSQPVEPHWVSCSWYKNDLIREQTGPRIRRQMSIAELRKGSLLVTEGGRDDSGSHRADHGMFRVKQASVWSRKQEQKLQDLAEMDESACGSEAGFGPRAIF